MNWIGMFVEWVNSIIGNYGLTIVALVCLSQILLIPAKMFAKKNRAAKQACEPEIQAIRKKYNANQLGVSMDDPEDLDPSVRKMSHDERDEAMANEIDAVYKKHGYHMWTAWIPTVINLAFLLLLWNGISQATPEGFYSVQMRTINTADPNHIWNIVLLAGTPTLSLLSGVISLISNIVKNKKADIPLKPVVIAGCVSLAISVGLSIWIATSVSTAIAIALMVLSAWSTIAGWITKFTDKTPANEL